MPENTGDKQNESAFVEALRGAEIWHFAGDLDAAYKYLAQSAEILESEMLAASDDSSIILDSDDVGEIVARLVN